jgi:membrane protein required for beta-lactamase induction
MTVQLLFGTSVAFGFVAWAVVTAVYIWPKIQTRSRIDALRPLLVLHAFRFIGLSFLVPGVVSPNLPLAFAHDAAYGDIVAAMLALAALATLRSGVGIALVWAVNLGVVSIYSTRSIRPMQPDYCQGSTAPPISFPQRSFRCCS